MGGNCTKQSKSAANKDLRFAALNGLDNWIPDLVREGADVNSRGRRGETPLIVATTGGYTKFMEVLIKHGADVNAVVDDWYYEATALHQATKDQSGKCMELLITAGADVNISTNRPPPLKVASLENNITCVKLLLKAGALVNIKSQGGFNATQCYILRYRNSKKPHDILTVLFAAGETTAKTFKYRETLVDVPRCLRELMEPDGIRLDDICRRKIRKHFLNLSSSENLFVRIPRLGLPAALESFLLYNVSLQ